MAISINNRQKMSVIKYMRIFPNVIPFVSVRVISETTISSDNSRRHGEGAEITRALKCSHVFVTFASQTPSAWIIGG